MTITVEIPKLGTTAIADVDILGLDQTKLQNTATDKSVNMAVSEYVLADGSLLDDVKVIVRRTFVPSANKGYGSTKYVWTLLGNVVITDDVLLTTESHPCAFNLSVDWPGNKITSVTEMRQGINNLFALTFPSVAAGVINDAYLTNLAYGIVALYG